MPTGGQFKLEPAAMATTITEMVGILTAVRTAVAALQGLTVPTSAYGAFGAPVAQASTAMQAQAGATLAGLHRTLVDLSGRLETTRGRFTTTDAGVAEAVRRLDALRPDRLRSTAP